jgi:hypothetical protein
MTRTVRAAAHLDVVGAGHGGHGHELQPVLQVERLGLDLLGVAVIQRGGLAGAPDHACVGERHPDVARRVLHRHDLEVVP